MVGGFTKFIQRRAKSQVSKYKVNYTIASDRNWDRTAELTEQAAWKP